MRTEKLKWKWKWKNIKMLDRELEIGGFLKVYTVYA